MNPNILELIHCIYMDIIPSPATCIDFGIPKDKDPTEVFGALQWALKRDIVTKEELEDARRNGQKLTKIANKTWERNNGIVQRNPYACKIRTDWDTGEE